MNSIDRNHLEKKIVDDLNVAIKILTFGKSELNLRRLLGLLKDAIVNKEHQKGFKALLKNLDEYCAAHGFAQQNDSLLAEIKKDLKAYSERYLSGELSKNNMFAKAPDETILEQPSLRARAFS